MEQKIIQIGQWLLTRSDGEWVLIGACLILTYGLDQLLVVPLFIWLHRETWL